MESDDMKIAGKFKDYFLKIFLVGIAFLGVLYITSLQVLPFGVNSSGFTQFMDKSMLILPLLFLMVFFVFRKFLVRLLLSFAIWDKIFPFALNLGKSGNTNDYSSNRNKYANALLLAFCAGMVLFYGFFAIFLIGLSPIFGTIYYLVVFLTVWIFFRYFSKLL